MGIPPPFKWGDRASEAGRAPTRGSPVLPEWGGGPGRQHPGRVRSTGLSSIPGKSQEGGAVSRPCPGRAAQMLRSGRGSRRWRPATPPHATQRPGQVVALAAVPAALLLAVPGCLLLTLGPLAWVLPPPGSLLVCRDLRGGRPAEGTTRESCPQPTWVQIPAAPHPGCAAPGRGCLLGASVSLLEARGWVPRAAHVWAVTVTATMPQVEKLRHRGMQPPNQSHTAG